MDQMLQTLTPEAQAEWEAEQRKRQIAQAMMKQFGGGVNIQQPNTPLMGKISPLAMLAGIGTNFLTQKTDSDAAARQKKIQGDAAKSTSEGLESFFRNVQPGAMTPGAPATPFGSRDMPQQDAQQPAPVDRNSIIAQTLASQNPMLRAAAANWQKQQMERSGAAAKIMGDYGDVQGAMKTINTGEIDPNYQPTPVKSAQIENITGPNGQKIPIARQFNRKGEETIHGLGGQQINVGNQVQKAGLEAVMKAAVDDNTEAGKAAQAAVRMKSTLSQLSALDENGVISGPATNPLQWMVGLARSANLPVDAAKLANSQSYNAFAQQAVQQIIAQNGGNAKLTEAETKLIQTTIPRLQDSPEARVQLTQILQNSADRKIAEYTQSRKDLVEAINAQDPTKYTFAGINMGALSPTTPMAASESSTKPSIRTKGDPPAGSGNVSPADSADLKKLVSSISKDEFLRAIQQENDPAIKAQLQAIFEMKHGKTAPASSQSGWRIVK